jgi:hypothetical protein
MDIDRIIRERMHGKPERTALQADLDEYLRRFAGKGPHRAQEEIEDLVSDAMDERRRDVAPG